MRNEDETMNDEELARAVDEIQGLHYVEIADVKKGREGSTIGDGSPPTESTLDMLYLDKLRLTAAAFGIPGDVSAWSKTSTRPDADGVQYAARFSATIDGAQLVFDSDRGMMYVTDDPDVDIDDDGYRYVEIHRPEDVPQATQ